MDTEVNLINTARLLLLQHIRLMLIVQELNDWHPRIAVVDIISEAWCINNCQADYQDVSERQMLCISNGHTLEKLLLKLSLCDLNLDSLVHLLCVSALVVGVVLDCRGEEGVDEGSLSESRFASNLGMLDSSRSACNGAYHNREGCPSLCDYFMALVRKICNPNGGSRLGSWWSHGVCLRSGDKISVKLKSRSPAN